MKNKIEEATNWAGAAGITMSTRGASTSMRSTGAWMRVRAMASAQFGGL